MKKPGWNLRLGAALLCVCVLLGGATVFAAQGDQNDPLVTLSYLTEVFTPSILKQVDTKTAEREKVYLDQLTALISEYGAAMDEKLAAQGVGKGAAVFAVVDLAAGQKLTGAVGCEIMLRVGGLSLVSPASPGLIDTTDGVVLEHGGALQKNHLYMFTVEGRSVQASGAVKVLARGSYTIG